MIVQPPSCVIDASVGVKLFLPEDFADRAQEFVAEALADRSRSLHVPDLFFVECANVLWKAVRRLGYPMSYAKANLKNLRMTGLLTTPTQQLAERAFEISCEYGISAYDACYVALAESLGAPLVTADNRLASKLAGSSHKIVMLQTV